MHEAISKVCNSLDELSEAIILGYTGDLTMNEAFGWNTPPMNRYDLAYLASSLSERLGKSDINLLEKAYEEVLLEIPIKIQLFIGNTLIYLYNGNGVNAIPVYMSLIQWIESVTHQLFAWDTVDNKAMPTRLTTRLRSIQIGIEEIVPEKEKLEAQLKLIQDAYDAAESLPTDMLNLKEARKKIESISTNASELFGKIDTHANAANEASKRIQLKEEEADKLVAQCNEAYRITTSTGLAGAFHDRANRLSLSMWIWVVGLILTLALGGWIGSVRYESLSKVLDVKNPVWGVIWIHISLSVVSVAAPIWFAWLSTKQIGQRFRLSEDYAFKASVAKAYEGYRREAARIDSTFEARLFASALTRLEEAPLRLVENDTHGSPWQELLSSDGFQKAIQSIPELRDKFMNIPKDILSTIPKNDRNIRAESKKEI
jgi:chaperonin cofactor prefoldin